jgi:hypothetical protein
MGVTRDTLKLQEEPAMAKKVRKSEKLDLILSELAKLRGEVKKLVRDRAAVAHQGVRAQPGSASGRPVKPPNPTAAATKPDKDRAASKPLVQAPHTPPQPTGRTGSH